MIGKNDRGEVVGLPDAKKLLEDIPNKVRDILGIMVEVNLHTEQGKDWLEIVVKNRIFPHEYRFALERWRVARRLDRRNAHRKTFFQTI